MKRICIDPGHGPLSIGRMDPGATRAGHRESDINLSYAVALAFICQQREIPHFLTRNTPDEIAPLNGRVARAVDAGCDVLISIHCNASINADAHGTETLYDQGRPFAECVQRAAMESIALRNRGTKHRPGLAMLKFPGPCALVELGFISNDEDRAKLLEVETRWDFARALLNALTKDRWI